MSKRKHILILADGFGPPAYTPRLRSICEVLLQDGITFDLVVEKIGALPFAHSYAINEVQLYNGSKIDWAMKNVWSMMTDWKNRTMSQYVENKYGKNKYDGVLCTTFHTFPMRAAVEFGQRHKIPVTLDVRDIVEQAPGNGANYVGHNKGILKWFVGPYHRINIRRRNHWLRMADHVTTISPWHVETLRLYNPNTELIYNGYDKERYTFEAVKSDRFLLSYIGKFFGTPLQDATLLFEALRELKDLPYSVEIHTNPEGKLLLEQLAKQYGLVERIKIGKYISQEEAISLYHRSSILLIFSNKASDKTVHGMMTTKFFEALGVEKPVLCSRSDEECLAAAIQSTNAGLAAKKKDEVIQFIREKYREWQKNGYTHQMVIDKEKYSRQNEVQLIENTLFIPCPK